MSAERIRQAALLRFAAQGYDATSMSEIAGDVGIKTPSIYAHFTGKQALFLQLVDFASAQELDLTRKALQRGEPIRAAMQSYLYDTMERYNVEPHLRFWLRSIYLPPASMHNEIIAHDRHFSLTLKEIILTALRDPNFGLEHSALPHETLTLAFLGILRGVHAELMYCNSDDSAKVLVSLWTVYERALTAVS